MKKLWYIHTMEYFAEMKNIFNLNITPQMDFTNSMLSEKPVKKTTTSHCRITVQKQAI